MLIAMESMFAKEKSGGVCPAHMVGMCAVMELPSTVELVESGARGPEEADVTCGGLLVMCDCDR